MLKRQFIHRFEISDLIDFQVDLPDQLNIKKT
jgi:hypothetical protein